MLYSHLKSQQLVICNHEHSAVPPVGFAIRKSHIANATLNTTFIECDRTTLMRLLLFAHLVHVLTCDIQSRLLSTMVTRDQWAGLAETFISFNSRTQVASYCLFYYDYLLTLPTEVRMVWGQRRLTLQSFFYLAIRYGCFVQITGTMFHNFNPTRGVEIIHAGTTCQAMGRAGAVLNLLNFCVISAFVALRLYAMYDRNWVLGILLFLLGSCSPTTIPQSIAWVFEEIHTPWPLPPCTEFIHGTKAYALYILNGQILPLSLSISSAVYELLCLSLTAAKTIRLYKLHRSIETIPITPSVTGLLLRDGTVYFA
ncbi:hypothetical protein C8Q80DRAFT_1161066 [Daedaleopsis nitida]|nr:hypothetical protein C8Q80DRAFT_1161066 [Daedaleopsis nitida]